MSSPFMELLDVSKIQGQGVTGADLFNPLALVQKLGYSFLGTYALYSLGLDQMVFDAMRQAGVPDQVAAPGAAVVIGAGADLIGGEAKRLVANVTNM